MRWAPPVLAAAITAEIACGGANDWSSRPLAALVNLLLSIVVLLSTEGRSRVWVRIRIPLLLFGGALLWAAVPRLLPASLAALIDLPPQPAPDRHWPALAEATSRLGLVLAGCVASYRLSTARPFVLWFAVAGGFYVGWMTVTPLPWQILFGSPGRRFAATIGNWNAAGTYFGMVAALCLATILMYGGAKRWGWHWLFVLPLLSGMVLCVATQSRSAFTLTTLALAISVSWHACSASLRASKRHGFVLIVPIGLAGMMVAYLGAPGLFPRYLALSVDSLSRWDIITTYFGYTLDAPLWGFGPGSFFEVNQARLTATTAPHFWNFGAAHNAPLQIVLEAGWPALSLLAVGVMVIVRDVGRRTWGEDDVGLIGALVVSAGASMVDIAWNVPALGALSCVLLGVLWGARPARPPSTQLIKRSSTGRARGVPVTS